MSENIEYTEFYGYSLFVDLDPSDAPIRDYNRAVVLRNMIEDESSGDFLSQKAAGMVLGYLSRIPQPERKAALTQLCLILGDSHAGRVVKASLGKLNEPLEVLNVG